MHSGKTTHEIRRLFSWTQEEMAIHWGIPLATIRNWDSRACMPDYVEIMGREIRTCWDLLNNANKRQET